MEDVIPGKSGSAPSRWLQSGIAGILLIAGIAGFLLQAHGGRGPNTYGDFAPVYSGALCILHRTSPYLQSNIEPELMSHGGPVFYPGYWKEFVPAYPPLTYYMISPLALLNFHAASTLYFALSALAFVVCCVMTSRLAPAESRVVVLLGVSAIMATSSVLLRIGQISTIVIAFIVAGSLLFVRGRYLLAAALLFFLASGLKPQLALPLVAYFCFPRLTRKYAIGVLLAFVVASAAAGLALAREPDSAHWTAQLLAVLHQFASAGRAGRVDTGLINVGSLTSLLSYNPHVGQATTVAILATLFVMIAIGYFRSASSPERDWIVLAAVTFFTLLVTYHRTYDMRIQILALPALGLLWRRRPGIITGLLTLLSCLALFSTAGRSLEWMARHYGEASTHTFAARLLVERQQADIILLIAILWAAVCFSLRSKGGARKLTAGPSPTAWLGSDAA